MESINGDMTQEEYDLIMAKLFELESEEYFNGVDNSKEIEKLKELIEYGD